jgi:hypothetical protein
MITTVYPKSDTFTRPTTEPIHLHGEADAFPGETFENAYNRLFDYGCQCGWSTSCQTDLGASRVFVHNGGEFRLDFPNGGELGSVWKYCGRSQGWKCLWASK